MTSDPRSSRFSEERRVSHSLILDISLQSHPSGADSEKRLRNLKVGSQGKGARESWPPDFQDLRTTRIIWPLIHAVFCSECLAQSNSLNSHNSPGKSGLFLIPILQMRRWKPREVAQGHTELGFQPGLSSHSYPSCSTDSL